MTESVSPGAGQPEGWGPEWDAVADVVVVGTGAAALAAAVAATHRGCSVLVLEKAALPGGTTAKSSGTTWIPDNYLMRGLGLVDERESALRYMARAAHPARYVASAERYGLTAEQYSLLEALYDHGSVAIDELVALDAFPGNPDTAPGFPDYYGDFPENAAPVGRSIQMRYPPGHRRGIDATGGQLLVEALLAAAQQRGAVVRYGHRVVRAIQDETGAVVGVEARRGTSSFVFGARRGVVFGTGGFLHNRELTDAFLRGPVFGGSGADTATGDFVTIGSQVGAKLGNMSHAWWDQVLVEDVLRARPTSRDCVIAFGDSMIMVNRFGSRVMNEKMPYNERGQAHFTWDPDRREFPNLLMFLIFDEAVRTDPRPSRHRFPIPSTLPGATDADAEGGSRLSADTWPELVAAIRTRLAEIAQVHPAVELAPDFEETLARTIRRFNELARTGVDTDHGRGQSPIEKEWATAGRDGLPNPTMAPFRETGPYHCILLGPGALDTKGGPVVDAAARVVGTDGAPIPGLFGAGNCIAAPSAQAYYGPGGTIGPALTFGHLAGVSAAAEKPRTPALS